VIAKPALSCDLLVLGSGIAGLRGAIEAADAGWRVLIATKDRLRESNTEYAQGGIAASLAEGDTPEHHLLDTLEAGDGLCRTEAVRVLVEEGPGAVLQLIDWGAAFDRDRGGLHFTREAAHGQNRILHARGDATGQELERTLAERAATQNRIQILSYHLAADLLLAGGRCAGAWLLDETDNRPTPVFARAVLVATGGLGRLFKESTNPAIATGDGMAMALRAGLVMADLEFVQFHPTALFLKNAPRFLLSESMRGEGAILRNADGQHFMDELQPRDVVTRGIVAEIERTGGRPVFLDLTHLKPDFVKARFPTIFATCLEYGLDITRQPIPVHPAAHYAMGGIETDLHGRTSMPGVFAAGESACSGVHGANRLASNSLLEGLVFGARAVRAALADPGPEPAVREMTPPDLNGCGDLEVVNNLRRRIAAVMWDGVGIIRDAAGIARARLELEGIRTHLGGGSFHRRVLETCNMALLGDAIAASAAYREESRGGHYRRDFPKTDDARWRRHTRLATGSAGIRFLEDDR
jgi:L-aspartate oxidase